MGSWNLRSVRGGPGPGWGRGGAGARETSIMAPSTLPAHAQWSLLGDFSSPRTWGSAALPQIPPLCLSRLLPVLVHSIWFLGATWQLRGPSGDQRPPVWALSPPFPIYLGRVTRAASAPKELRSQASSEGLHTYLWIRPPRQAPLTSPDPIFPNPHLGDGRSWQGLHLPEPPHI